MTTAAAKRIKAKRARRPIYGVIERVAVLSTGEERLAIIAAHPIDRKLMAERGFRRGDEVRLEVKQPRNVNFHRLLHAVGQLMVDNVEDWEGLTSHDAVKRLQLESDTCCETVEMDATPVVSAILDACESLLGTGARKVLAGVLPELQTIPVKQAESLAFDEMPPERFSHLFEGITKHIGDEYAHVMLDDVRAEFWSMVQGEAA